MRRARSRSLRRCMTPARCRTRSSPRRNRRSSASSDALIQRGAPMPDNSRGAVLVRAIEICIKPYDGAISALGTLFTDDVTAWSPNLLATGLADLAESLAVRETTFSDVAINFTSLGVLGSKGFAEFQVAATFAGPFVVDDEVALEPNGRQLVIGAAAVADFNGDEISSIRVYFDDATLLEQMFAEKV